MRCTSIARCAQSACAALLLALAGTARAAQNAPDVRAASASAASTAPAQTAPARPLELGNTAVYELVAHDSGRRYPIWVDVPDSYADAGKPLPVVFVTDALYAFPLVRSIRNLLGQHGRNIEDFILVGLPPASGDTSRTSRSRDYTPTDPLAHGRQDPDDYGADHYGEAATYRDFIERQVFPLIAANYRADMQRKTFAGHSLGGLFGSFVLVTKPSMFERYILSSPSLWFDNHAILAYADRYLAAHDDLPARVMLYAGSFETPRPGPRYFKKVDMIGDMRAFAERLRKRGYRGLSIGTKVVGDEDHLSVYPSTISRGLLWALPGSGPYTSG